MKSFFFIFFLPLQIFSQIQGKVRLDRLIVDRDDPERNLNMSATIWYLGNRSIQEIPSINIKSDSLKSYTTTFIKYYLLIDPDLQAYLYFKTFSDTSSIIKYSKGIKIFDKYGGWDLYSSNLFDYESYVRISDTSLNGANYNRYRFRKILDGKKNDFVIYVNCKNKRTPVMYLKPLSNKIGCPVIRMEIYYDNRLTGITQLYYLSNKLTDTEIKVFQIGNKPFK